MPLDSWHHRFPHWTWWTYVNSMNSCTSMWRKISWSSALVKLEVRVIKNTQESKNPRIQEREQREQREQRRTEALKHISKCLKRNDGNTKLSSETLPMTPRRLPVFAGVVVPHGFTKLRPSKTQNLPKRKTWEKHSSKSMRLWVCLKGCILNFCQSYICVEAVTQAASCKWGKTLGNKRELTRCRIDWRLTFKMLMEMIASVPNTGKQRSI